MKKIDDYILVQNFIPVPHTFSKMADGGPTILPQNCISDNELSDIDDDFTDAQSFLSNSTEEDCDCCEDYTCEWHFFDGRHDKLYEEALYVFRGRCKSGGPNPKQTLSSLFIPVINENIQSMREYHMSEECFVSLFLNTVTFAISEPALNNTKYRMFILNMFTKTRELRDVYPSNRDIQRAYRNWSRFILNVK